MAGGLRRYFLRLPPHRRDSIMNILVTGAEATGTELVRQAPASGVFVTARFWRMDLTNYARVEEVFAAFGRRRSSTPPPTPWWTGPRPKAIWRSP
jgi:hypothetical protein